MCDIEEEEAKYFKESDKNVRIILTLDKKETPEKKEISIKLKEEKPPKPKGNALF